MSHNPIPEGQYGTELFEHWEDNTSQPQLPHLLLIASTPNGMTLQPGDTILKRLWVPASPALVYNQAQLGPAPDLGYHTLPHSFRPARRRG